MRRIMMMMVMMLTIVVSTSGKTNTGKDRKNSVNVELNIHTSKGSIHVSNTPSCPPPRDIERGHRCNCKCHGTSWRSNGNKPCKKCLKQMRKMQQEKRYDKHFRH